MHVKIQTQCSAELTQLGELIENMPIAMLTNIHSDGALVSRPMSPLEMDADGAVWFFVDATTSDPMQLEAVNLSFSDVTAGTYVSLSGRGEIDLDRARMDRMWTPFAKAWFPGGASSPDLALLKVVPHTAEYWDAPHSRMVRMFAMAAAVVTGQPIAIGDHDTLTDLSKDSPKDSSNDLSKHAWDESSKLSSTVEAE
jgi:general stress protein 26